VIYQFEQFALDTSQYRLLLKDSEITVRPQVFDLLVYLIENRDRLVTRDELLENLWQGKVVTDSALGVQLKNARKAVNDTGAKQRVIKTVHGRGYQFIADVIESETDADQGYVEETAHFDSPLTIPKTCFAENDGVSIAYQIFGKGDHDLVIIPGWLSNIDIFWEQPHVIKYFLSLAKFARVILIDKRGTGLSDRVTPPTLEEQIDDVTAVMDAAGSRKAVLLGNSGGGSMCALFAASHPDRTASLILIGSNAKCYKSDDYPHGADREDFERWFSEVEKEWGGPISIEPLSPSLSGDEEYRRWWAKFMRSSASKKDAIAMLRMSMETDLLAVLPTINVPTLVLQAIDDRTNPLEEGRDLAHRIPGAKLIEVNAGDHVPWGDGADEIVGHIKDFLSGVIMPEASNRILTTVLYFDLNFTGSLQQVFLDEARAILQLYRGKELKIGNSGFNAIFDGPGRAVQCAWAIRESAQRFELVSSFGLHAGECRIGGETLEGAAFRIAASLAAINSGGEILVSRTIMDLVAGSGIKFEKFTTHSIDDISDGMAILKVLAV
jgi:pimeloyl-ACP methyl ester carboxylesterase